MIKRETKNEKRWIVAAAVLTGFILLSLTVLFIQGVRHELWEQSVNTIMESTRQGCGTLKIQMKDAYDSMDTIRDYIEDCSAEQTGKLDMILDSYSRVEKGTSLYLDNGICIPKQSQPDQKVWEELREVSSADSRQRGIIDPHISSATGVNVFDLYVRTNLADGAGGWFVKEYEVEEIVDSFSLSFYNNSGFSYVVNSQGDILIRSPHPNSNKTIRNIFDILSEEQNDRTDLETFRQALDGSLAGYAVFRYQDKKTVFCYVPLQLESDWHLISIIPMTVVNAQTNRILARSMLLIASILTGILILAAFYMRYVKRTSRKLDSQAQYIGRLYNAMPEGVALISVREPYQLFQVNEEGLRMMGYPPHTANDAPKGSVLNDWVHPEDCAKTAGHLKNAVQDGSKHVFEHRLKGPDGIYFWASVIVEKSLDENGLPILIAAFHDITNEKQAQEELERMKLQERTTLVGALSNAYPVIVSINLTKDTVNYIYVREGLMVDLGDQHSYQALYKAMEPSVHPDYQEEFKRRFALGYLQDTLGKEKNEVYLEMRQKLSDGNYHWTSSQIIYVDNPYSEERLAILISRRADEQRYEAEQQRLALQSALDSAKAASNAKGRFLSNMSHDIRTPMNAIIGMTAIAAMHIDDRERVLECLKKISLSGEHLVSLINDILDMSKIESGKLTLREEPFNLAALISDTVELIRSQAAEKRQWLEVHMSVLKQEEVVGDPLRVRQIGINILSNAVKYTPEGGSIRIDVKQGSSRIRGYQSYTIRCEDTGIGMSPEFMEHLFTPFERAQDSTNSRIAGTGLGMTITKNIVDMMDGDIQVESTPGKGSVFTVTLPLKPQEDQAEMIPEEWLGVRSLIADDDMQVGEDAVELLADMGLRAQFVTGGRAAVRCVAEAMDEDDPYRLVILDWKMPDLDGVETTRRIRKMAGSDVPVIVLTAYDWSEIEAEAKEAGVTAFIGKPFYRSKICYLLRELSGSGETETPKQPERKASYPGKRVLIAEDNEINREIVRMLMESMEIELEEACDGEEVVRKVRESEEGYYDLIFMDIQMPGMDGYEATKVIRDMDRGDVSTLPIVAMTANAFEEDVRAALRAGMDAHLAKPIDYNSLAQMMGRFLSDQ